MLPSGGGRLLLADPAEVSYLTTVTARLFVCRAVLLTPIVGLVTTINAGTETISGRPCSDHIELQQTLDVCA